MTIIEMLQQSTILTVLGMAIVFIFLWVMIICINFAGNIIRGISTDKDIVKHENKILLPKETVKSETIAVISAAAAEYEKKTSL